MSGQQWQPVAVQHQVLSPELFIKRVEKWITENDRTLNTLVWLKFEANRHGHVLSLKCSICSQFKDKLVGM